MVPKPTEETKSSVQVGGWVGRQNRKGSEKRTEKKESNKQKEMPIYPYSSLLPSAAAAAASFLFFYLPSFVDSSYLSQQINRLT